jgi:hypothetical protein
LLVACGTLPLVACEHTVDLEGKVSVPAQVQRIFSAQHPGELVVIASMQGQPDIAALGMILCDPVGGERVIDVKYSKAMCATEKSASISAWIVPRTAQEVSCASTTPRPRAPEELQSLEPLASARAVVPVTIGTMAPESCKDGSISFALTLAPR